LRLNFWYIFRFVLRRELNIRKERQTVNIIYEGAFLTATNDYSYIVHKWHGTCSIGVEIDDHRFERGGFMKTKKLMTPVLLVGLLFSMLITPSSASPNVSPTKDKQEAKQPATKIYIPKEVKEVLIKGLPTREARKDIPFSIFKSTFLPAQNAFYIFTFLKIKNSDLGYAPVPAPQVADAAVPAQPKLRAAFHVFLQFHKMENGTPTQVIKEVYVPAAEEEDAANYDPNKEEWYSFGYPLLPGNYLLAMAVTSKDLKKIGTQYFEFSLPQASAFAQELGTTPILFLKDYKEVDSIEKVTALHRGAMRFSLLQIVPNIDNTLSVGDSLDLFLTILGAQPDAQNKYDIECQYEVKKGDESVIKFALAKYENPYISQPLPMKRPIQITKGTEVSQEEKDLPAGSYTLTLKIADKISGKTCVKAIDFTVK